MKYLVLILFAVSLVSNAQQYTRGIGVYPGDPKEYTGPSLTADAGTYRNLALHRPAYQSSAYDYNLTAQLITDGIKTRDLPQWIVTSTSDKGILGKEEREVFLDGNVTSSVDVSGENPWIEFDIEGGLEPPEIDHVDLYIRKIYGRALSGTWTYVVSGSDDGVTWKELGRSTGSDWPDMRNPGPSFKEPVVFTAPAHSRSYRVHFSAPNVHMWGVAEIILFDKDQEVRIAGPDLFSSAWMSAGNGEEWVYVDLGATSTFDRVTLSWVRRAVQGFLETSDDAKQWQILQPLPVASGLSDDIRLSQPAHGRYVRLRVTKTAEAKGQSGVSGNSSSVVGSHYILSELEVFGRGGRIAVPHLPEVVQPDHSLPLAGGNWRLQRASLVPMSGEQLSTPGFVDKDWIIATVPGTVLTSYLNDEAVANPDFGDNQYAVSDSFFCADFWYRDEFIAPIAREPQQRTWLNFDGINWKAEIYFNGQKVGRIEGGFLRGRFDVTALVHPGVTNALAVRIIRAANPGSTKDKAGKTVNGGALGRDNPTYHASAGWDWISTIRGRNTGIWSNVSLTTSGAVTIENPLVSTTLPLPETTHADIFIQATLHNQEARRVSGNLRAQFGELAVETQVTLDPSSTKTIDLTPLTNPALRITNPKLWWPVGYGEPNLYPVALTFIIDGNVSDTKSFQSGIRQFTYSEEGDVLKIFINGRRFIAHGGNWGFSESMLRYRAREYETALRYHRDEHFNMIRNWVGQIGDEAFYEAADRNGVVIWQDFWLANPWDGPDPDDNDLFLKDAKDYLLRIRNHASLGIFCGRNEGFPPKPIDDGLSKLVATLEPGSHYISSSADGPVSGHGPYRVEPLRYYFDHAPAKLHSEMGSPNLVEMDSLRRTMPESAMWPQGGYQWPLHDFHPENPFKTAIDQQFGGADNIADWVGLAQFVNYDVYRGMFEGQSKNRLGLLIWMSHPAWPSLLWQTYDYFFETDAGYFAAKKASEPIHIQWNAASDAIEIVNYSAGEQFGLTAHAEVLNLDGSVKWEKTANVDSHEDSTSSPIQLEFPAGLSRTHFIRLTLSRGDTVLSSNFYLRGLSEGDYKDIKGMPSARIAAKSHINHRGSQWEITTELHNVSTIPALMVRIRAVRDKSGDPILPALYTDNYIALMPGERKKISIELKNADTRGEAPRITVAGYNVADTSRR
jgi:Exo-beta-D-glucosaminidase Ig-fold domain/Glycosyl hydrolases family 2/F5/8 type C domain/Glycosyl hydrolases family 2, sugar binding domain